MAQELSEERGNPILFLRHGDAVSFDERMPENISPGIGRCIETEDETFRSSDVKRIVWREYPLIPDDARRGTGASTGTVLPGVSCSWFFRP
jgi:hypothetical protein